jgi:carbon storage regulator
MLVLTRRVGESIRIGDDITVTLVQIGPGKVRLGIEAAPDVVILREELIGPAAPKGLPVLPTSDSDTASSFRVPHAK